MTNTAALLDRIEKSGLKRGFIARQCGISYPQLNKKIHNKAPFKAAEIQTLCNILQIEDLNEKEQIFFALDVE